MPSCFCASRHSSESWEAVGALARHVILKTPDKADFRMAASDAAVTLMAQLPVMHQHQFVLFTARLARTPKVGPTSTCQAYIIKSTAMTLHCHGRSCL